MTSIANMMLRSFGTYIMIMSMVDMMMKMILKNDDHLHSLAFSCHNVRDDPDNKSVKSSYGILRMIFNNDDGDEEDNATDDEEKLCY